MEKNFEEPKFEKEKQRELNQISKMADTFELEMSEEVRKLYMYVNARLEKMRYYAVTFFVEKEIGRIVERIDKLLESNTLGEFDELAVRDLREQVSDFLDYEYVGPVDEPKRMK